MTLNASLKNRVRRLETQAVQPRAHVSGVVLRPGTTLAQALKRITAATALADTVYITNLARLRLPME